MRFSAEEILRRQVNSNSKEVVDDIAKFLFDDHKVFVDRIWAKKEKEMNKLMNVDNKMENPYS